VKARPPGRPYSRVPTGEIDRELGVSVSTDAPVPVVQIRTYRRSPCELSDTGFAPTDEPVRLELQFAELLADAIRSEVTRAAEVQLWAPAPGAAPGGKEPGP